MAWTDEKKQEVIDTYLASDPTPANSAEICKKIADDMEESANGVRMILMAAKVYVKKDDTATKGKTTAKKDGDKPARVSKDSQIAALADIITNRGEEVDMEILGKLTGKAAVYFTKVLSA